MAKVALVVSGFGSQQARAIVELKAISGLGIAELREAITKSAPILERPLFSRQDPDFPTHLLSAMRHLDELGVSYDVFELLSSQTYLQQNQSQYYRVTCERLSNIIATHESSLEQQRFLDERESGID
jgi:hypothetical protein